MICDKCNGTGKLTVEKILTMTTKETVEVDCDLCGGTGQIPEDPMTQIIARLDRIIAILEQH
jgi:DnaJ-class molecular chaperone